ncbi:hypothetical protein [Paenibacillus sp. yr247]|uniref:hypothetical protein n=1 Tax=Paenibacillus sp. yr247 TaxID=1761880 RepID=UPI0034A25EB8
MAKTQINNANIRGMALNDVNMSEVRISDANLSGAESKMLILVMQLLTMFISVALFQFFIHK